MSNVPEPYADNLRELVVELNEAIEEDAETRAATSDWLTEWEYEFVVNMATRIAVNPKFPLSDKQADKIEEVHRKMEEDRD